LTEFVHETPRQAINPSTRTRWQGSVRGRGSPRRASLIRSPVNIADIFARYSFAAVDSSRGRRAAVQEQVRTLNTGRVVLRVVTHALRETSSPGCVRRGRSSGRGPGAGSCSVRRRSVLVFRVRARRTARRMGAAGTRCVITYTLRLFVSYTALNGLCCVKFHPLGSGNGWRGCRARGRGCRPPQVACRGSTPRRAAGRSKRQR